MLEKREIVEICMQTVAAAVELLFRTHLVVVVRFQRIYAIYLSFSGCLNWLKVNVDNVDIYVYSLHVCLNSNKRRAKVLIMIGNTPILLSIFNYGEVFKPNDVIEFLASNRFW